MVALNPRIQAFIAQVLPEDPHTFQALGQGDAPVNIALSKYWGKRDTELNLPTNGSLSISLPKLGTQTQIQWHPDLSAIQVELNGKTLADSDPFAQRLANYLTYFRPDTAGNFHIITHNSVPTAAGLASSASGYAALVLALDDLFQWQLSKEKLSLLARLGSGSASRSIYEGFAIWHQGQQEDGLDSYAQALDAAWPELCIGLLEIDISQKPVSSTQGMQQTVNTCELYQAWPQKAEQDLKIIKQAILQQDFATLGATAENNALSMHATMIATWPPILYWQAESVSAMHRVWQLRQEGIEVYFTMDAGPNLKLLFLEQDQTALEAAFPQLKTLKPFKTQSH